MASSSSWGLGGDSNHHQLQQRSSHRGGCEIAIFWDYENVPLPSWCNAAVAAKAIVNAVSSYGRIVDRRLYYDFEKTSSSATKSTNTASNSTSQQQYLDSSGFNLVNTPSRHNNNSNNTTTTTTTLDKKLIPDLLTFAWDAAVRNGTNNNNSDDHHTSNNISTSNKTTAIVLLTSDGDYAYTLSKLRDRGVLTIVIVGTSATGGGGPVSNNILVDVADVALSLQDDVLRPEQEKRNIPMSSSSLSSSLAATTATSATAMGARGMGASAATADTTSHTLSSTSATFAGGVDSTTMDMFLVSFCRLIQDRMQKDHQSQPWQNYASVSELLQRIIRQNKPSTSSDLVKELTKQIRLQACSLNLIQVGRRCIRDYHNGGNNSNSNSSSSVVGEIIPSTHAHYNAMKLSLEVYVGLLPRGHAVALGQESVNSATSSGGGDVASSTSTSTSNNKGSTAAVTSTSNNKKVVVDTESLVLELCRIIQQKAASSADAWVDLGQVLARIQQLIRQQGNKYSSSSSNKKGNHSAAIKDHEVKEMARSTREVAATRGLIAIGKRRLENKNSSGGEEPQQQREIIALSKNTRHLTLSGESYVCLLPKGEMLLASPPSSSTTAPTLEEEQEQEREAPMSMSSPSSSSFQDASSNLSLALCRIIRQRAISMEGEELAWVDLGETMSQLQQMMRGNNTSSSTDDVKDKARAARLQAVARGLLESGRRVLDGKKRNNISGLLNSEKEIVVINKDIKNSNVNLGEYYLRLLPQGNVLVTSDSSCEAMPPSSTTPLSASSSQTPPRGVNSGEDSDFVSLAEAVQQYSSQKDGWAGLGSVLSQFQKSLRKGSHSPYSSNAGGNQEEIKNQARSLREQAVDEGIIEMGRRRLDRTDLDGEREIVVVHENSNVSHPLDRNLSTESYVRLLFKGESLLKKGMTLTVATTTVSYKAALETPAPPPPPTSPPPNCSAIREASTEAQSSISTMVFIRNLPPETQIRELVRFLEDSFSITIIRARIRNGQFSTMVAHIEVSSESQATKLIEKSKNQTTGGQALYYHNRKIMMFPETLKSSLDVRGDDSMFYQKYMPTTTLSSTPPTLAETTLSHTFDEATEMDAAPELACIVLCRNCPRVTHVLELVRFLQNTFPVTVCRALIEVADATSSNAHVELLHASEAAMLMEQAKGGNGLVFRNRRITVFPCSSTIELDTKGDDTMYYDGDDVGEYGTLTLTDSFIDAAADRLVQAQPGTTCTSQAVSNHLMALSSITQTASCINAPPGLCIQPGASIPTADTAAAPPDVAWLCLTLLSQANKPGLDPNGWIYGANIGAPFRSLLPREYTQTASKDEMSARFKNARTMAVEGGYIEVGRRRQDENDIVTVPLSSFGQNPTDQNFTLDVFFRLLAPGRSLALETKNTARPTNDEFQYYEGNKKAPFSKYLFMNNLPLSTSSEELSGFLESNFTCAVKGIRLKENTWEGLQVQSGHVELESIAEAVEILRVAKTPPGLFYCGNFIYTVIDAFPPEPVEHVTQPLKLRDFIDDDCAFIR